MRRLCCPRSMPGAAQCQAPLAARRRALAWPMAVGAAAAPAGSPQPLAFCRRTLSAVVPARGPLGCSLSPAPTKPCLA